LFDKIYMIIEWRKKIDCHGNPWTIVKFGEVLEHTEIRDVQLGRRWGNTKRTNVPSTSSCGGTGRSCPVRAGNHPGIRTGV
jgi:hypothetical protein